MPQLFALRRCTPTRAAFSGARYFCRWAISQGINGPPSRRRLDCTPPSGARRSGARQSQRRSRTSPFSVTGNVRRTIGGSSVQRHRGARTRVGQCAQDQAGNCANHAANQLAADQPAGRVADDFGDLHQRLNLRPCGRPPGAVYHESAGGTTNDATTTPRRAPASKNTRIFTRSFEASTSPNRAHRRARAAPIAPTASASPIAVMTVVREGG